MNKKLVVYAFILIGLTAGIWYVWSWSNTKVAGEWLTYRDKKHGFEFTYPFFLDLEKKNNELRFETQVSEEGFSTYADIKVHDGITNFRWTSPFRREDFFSFDPVTGNGNWQRTQDDSLALNSIPAGTTNQGVNYYRQASGDAGSFAISFLVPLRDSDTVVEFRVLGYYPPGMSGEAQKRAQELEKNYTQWIGDAIFSTKTI